MRMSDSLGRSLRAVRTGAPAPTRRRIVLRSLVFVSGLMLFLAVGPQLPGAQSEIALLVSAHTYDYFTNAYEPFKCNYGDWNLGTHEYDRYYKGWEWILNDAGLPYTVIADNQISATYLKTFKVLILPNNFWLDDSQTKIIADWVRDGGHLLATFGSGYAGVGAEFKKGGTNGLHELWGDPSSKLNSSFYIGNPAVDLQITQNGGPTAGFNSGAVVNYQWMANVLIQRPSSSRDINAFFLFNGQPSSRPAIFNNRHAKGLVVYYAFAPEYLIALANDVAGHCTNDLRYTSSDPAWVNTLNALKNFAAQLAPLMHSTLNYLK